VQVILAARIDRLSPEDKQLLHAASVVGKDIPLALLERVADLAPDRLAGGLARLQAAEFLYETSLFPDPEYTFKHALTHEVAYGSLLGDCRRELHRRIGAAIEQRHPQPAEEEVEQLAHHSLRGELWEKAAGYLRQAGLKATAQSASREAVAWLDQAFVAIDHLPAGRERDAQAVDVRLDLRSPLFQLGEFRRLVNTLQEAQALAADLDDQSRRGWVLAFLANHTFQCGDLDEAMGYARRAADIAEGLGDLMLGMVVNMYTGQILFGMGEYDRAIKTSQETVQRLRGDLTREGARQSTYPLIVTSSFVGRAFSQIGRFDEAMRHLEEGVIFAEAMGQPFGLAVAYYAIGQVHVSRGMVQSAIPLLERGLTIARATGGLFQIALNMGWLGYAYTLVGRVDEGLALLGHSIARGEAIELWGGIAAIVVIRSDAYRRARRWDEAHVAAQSGLELPRRLKRHGSEAEALCVLGDIAATSTPLDAGAAEAHYRQSMALAEPRGMRPLLAHCHLGLGRLYSRTGKRQEVAGAPDHRHDDVPRDGDAVLSGAGRGGDEGDGVRQ
jgi:tetratricopeptide (TPR) repeat protein